LTALLTLAGKERTTGRMNTPLQCVTRVRNVDLLADMPTKNRLPVRVDFNVQGVGPWTCELSVYVPTAEQMAAVRDPTRLPFDGAKSNVPSQVSQRRVWP
jgi:hypothetical protein